MDRITALLYKEIETAAQNDAPVIFPSEAVVSTTMFAGTAIRVNDLYWMDEHRNFYQVWLEAQHRRFAGGKVLLPGLYVAGTCNPDGFFSGRTSMIREENRYYTII